MKAIEDMTVKEYIKYLEHNPNKMPAAVDTIKSLFGIFDTPKEKFIFRTLSPSQVLPCAIVVHSESKDNLLYRVSECTNIKDTLLIRVSSKSSYIYYLLKTKCEDYSFIVSKLIKINHNLLMVLLNEK